MTKKRWVFGTTQTHSLSPSSAIYYSLMSASNLTSLGLSSPVFKMRVLIFVL